MRKKLGDWFKVLQLLKVGPNAKKISENDPEMLESDMLSSTAGAGSDIQLEEAYNEIGEYYVERQRWDTAVKYFIMGRNLIRQAECYYILEDYDSLCKVLDQLPENSEMLPVFLFLVLIMIYFYFIFSFFLLILKKLAIMFESVGMCKEACEAYLKAQNVKSAVDCCVKLNQWDEGIRLAKQYNITHVDNLLAKQANIFLEQNKVFNAIELYRKARHYLDAARHMFEARI